MAGSAKVTTERLRGMLDAVAMMSADLSLDGLLERILRLVGGLVDAECGYLDVVDRRTDRRLGVSASFGFDNAASEGRSGRELLVDLMNDPTRLAGREAPTEPSLPHGSLDVIPFIGVPIRIHDRHFGNLYLAGRSGGEGFTLEDEDVVLALASSAGVVIDSARLHEQSERQHPWLEAAADITTALLGPISRPTALRLVADRARHVAAADLVALLMPLDHDTLVIEAISGLPGDGLIGEQVDARNSIAGDAARTRSNIVVPDTEREPRYAPHKAAGWPDLGSLMVLPLRGAEETGALIIGWFAGHETSRWELDTVQPQRFADQAALVLQVVKAKQDQGRLAVFEDRDRIGRDLHDLVIQRLFAIGLMLDNTTKLISGDEATVRLSSVIDEIDEAIKDIRRTIFALSPTLSAGDLRIELENTVDHAAELLGFRPDLRLNGPVDSVVTEVVRENLLAVLGEALSNIVRHAGASRVLVEVDVRDNVVLTVEDNGRGLGDSDPGTGLRNMRHRAELLGGRCEVAGSTDEGAAVHWVVPLVRA